MSNDERRKIKKEHEMRSKDISTMIDEGGLGADKYYDIVKGSSVNSETKDNNRDE